MSHFDQLNTFIHSNYVQISYLSQIYMPFKSVFERNPLSILPKHHRLENMVEDLTEGLNMYQKPQPMTEGLNLS